MINCSFLIDGTLQEKLKPVYLYQAIAATKSGSSVPVGQMVSSNHDNITIARWLEDVFRNVNSPQEVVIDESAALLLAPIKAFTQFNNLPSYLQCCHGLLLDSSIDLPTTFIRHDVSHMVKTIKRASVFKSIDKRQSDFYKYCIGILFKLDDFEYLKLIVEDILTIAWFEFESNDVTEPARKRLHNLIETHSI